MKKTLFVKITASPITTTRRFYPLVNIVLYYLQKLRTCYTNSIHFVSPINTSTVSIHCSSTHLAEKLVLNLELYLSMCRAISFNQRNKGMDEMPSIARKRLLRKKFEQYFTSALLKNQWFSVCRENCKSSKD